MLGWSDPFAIQGPLPRTDLDQTNARNGLSRRSFHTAALVSTATAGCALPEIATPVPGQSTATPAIGPGNIDASLFSYGGIIPGPTTRMRGDETLFLTLRNHLGKDFGDTFVAEYPDPAPLTDEMKKAATKRG